ncbi:MAG: 2-oxoacid:acceptor oxidoreductase [Comamonadaceae bacterium]|nr:2-oxoacid:acceptor oxidoreductase family protein [Rubrivivax sp.]NLZ42238.1 2-oxoacid:acceptor oxidoreductase [Comamonadaceae bacterium]
MLQIVIQGRGGQGAQTAGNLLAAAYFAAGREVQCFASYGGARRGTPVSSFLRVDDRPVRLRCDIERADAILCFDASLLGPALLACADAHTRIVVNSSRPAAEFAPLAPGRLVLPVDALGLARRHGLGRIVNSALVGALARTVGGITLPVLNAAIAAGSPRLAEANVAACSDGWEAAERLLETRATR